jgi:CBS domain-containing protein
MKLIELLDARRVVLPLEDPSLAEAARALVDAMVQSGVVADPAALRKLVLSALPRDVVTVGEAFLLHYRTDAVRRLSAAVGVAPKGLRRHPEGELEARIVILLVAPPGESSAHLRAVSTFARALSRREVTDAMLAAKEADDIVQAAPLADIELPGYLTVRDVMVRRRLSLRPDMVLGEAAKLMVAHDVAALPVVAESGEVLGMVTHQELLGHLLPAYVKRESTGELRAAPRGSSEVPDPHAIPVREVMDRSVLCISEEQTLADIASMMLTRSIERFPVVHDGTLVGFLTRGDIVRRLFGR